jgi:glycine betaine/choline ABC-type transport system substrate-binding protein
MNDYNSVVTSDYANPFLEQKMSNDKSMSVVEDELLREISENFLARTDGYSSFQEQFDNLEYNTEIDRLQRAMTSSGMADGKVSEISQKVQRKFDLLTVIDTRFHCDVKSSFER